ncbi:MAG TPA: hypothetical protein VFQ44_30865 [Streptosporangiaceae bacterium]|nr:hypothetical protein [Streptosporangiaceae bacterium]
MPPWQQERGDIAVAAACQQQLRRDVAARHGEDLDPDRPCLIRVIEYEVPDREGDGKGELITLIATITGPRRAPPPSWPRPTTSDGSRRPGTPRLKTHLRGLGKIPRPQSPEMVRQELWGCLRTHYAISALICTAATAAGIDPDRVKFNRTVRIFRRRVADPAFSP